MLVIPHGFDEWPETHREASKYRQLPNGHWQHSLVEFPDLWPSANRRWIINMLLWCWWFWIISPSRSKRARSLSIPERLHCLIQKSHGKSGDARLHQQTLSLSPVWLKTEGFFWYSFCILYIHFVLYVYIPIQFCLHYSLFNFLLISVGFISLGLLLLLLLLLVCFYQVRMEFSGWTHY